MRGGRDNVSREELDKIPDVIEGLGYELASRHQSADGVAEREVKMKPKEIHDRDYAWLLSSNIGIFEISNPSLGVGGEISDCVHLKKPVLCLMKRGLENKVSAYTRGRQGSEYFDTPFECHSYNTKEDLGNIIEAFVEKYK